MKTFLHVLPFKRQRPQPPQDFLDTPLLTLNEQDIFTIRDSFNGAHVFGAIGSGKTSATGKQFASGFLRNGYGGLVCVAKPEESELWKNYCKEHGREQDLIVFDRTRHFNFLQYEFSRKGAEAASSVTDVLMKILKAADIAAGQGEGKDGEAFWIKTTREMILNTISLFYSATGTVTIDNMVAFISTMPATQAVTPEEKTKQAKNFAMQMIVRFRNNPVHPLPEHSRLRVLRYWLQIFPGQPEKTRGSIKTSVCAELCRFTDGLLRECFCTSTDLLPEMVFNGSIILLNFPVLTHNEEGICAQTLFKLMFQRAIESRNGLAKEFHERPVFLYADEAQFFVSLYDDTFLSTCRGSRCAVVYMTQSLPTYFAQLGKDKSDAVDGFVGKFGTKIFHLNACSRTNKYASELIGRGLVQQTPKAIPSPLAHSAAAAAMAGLPIRQAREPPKNLSMAGMRARAAIKPAAHRSGWNIWLSRMCFPRPSGLAHL